MPETRQHVTRAPSTVNTRWEHNSKGIIARPALRAGIDQYCERSSNASDDTLSGGPFSHIKSRQTKVRLPIGKPNAALIKEDDK